MKTSLFLMIVLVSGGVAGLIHGSSNLLLVEPYLDAAIGIENQKLFASGEAEDTLDFWVKYDAYRTWQKEGQLLSGVVLGISFGALFGIVFALSRNSLPGNNDVKKSLILAGVMWAVLYIIPFLKYPANPPGVGEETTVALRGILYLSLIAISGLSAFGFYKLSKKFAGKKKLVSLLSYSVFMSIVIFVMPSNTDSVQVSPDLMNGFRTMSVLAVSTFWVSIGVILGLFWRHFKPNKEVASIN